MTPRYSETFIKKYSKILMQLFDSNKEEETLTSLSVQLFVGSSLSFFLIEKSNPLFRILDALECALSLEGNWIYF